MRPEDVDVRVDHNLLAIRGDATPEAAATDGDYVYRELDRGSLSRSFWLPTGANTNGARA